MLSSILPQVSAFESETKTSEGTTFNIPVINKVGEKEKTVKKENPIAKPLMSTLGETLSSTSSGGTDQVATITTVIKNKNGVEVAKNTDAQFENFYSWYGYYYFNMLDNIEVGEYTAFVTIKIGDTIIDI